MSTNLIFVVVCQNDKPHPRWGVDDGGPLVHEQYTNTATLENMQKLAAAMEIHGACRVARLVFDQHPERAQDMLDALRQWLSAERTGDEAELANAREARDAAILAATGCEA